METFLPITMLPATSVDPAARDLPDVDVAIELVRRGAVHRVRLVGLRDPVGAAALAGGHALAVDVAIALERDGRHVTVVVTRRT